LSDEFLRDTEYYYTLIEQVNTQHYDRKIGRTKIIRAQLNDQKVTSHCELEKLRMIVAAKEREKKVESQPAQNAGSAPEPLVVHGQSDLRL